MHKRVRLFSKMLFNFKIIENYKFTDKKHTKASIMSFILGVISLVSIVVAAVMPYFRNAATTERYGMVCFLSVIMSIAGIVLAVLGKLQKASYSFFSKAGLVINIVVILIGGFIIYIGAFL